MYDPDNAPSLKLARSSASSNASARPIRGVPDHPFRAAQEGQGIARAILALDQGTTSEPCNGDPGSTASVVASAQEEFPQIFRRLAGSKHIRSDLADTAAELPEQTLERLGRRRSPPCVTNQRETVIICGSKDRRKRSTMPSFWQTGARRQDASTRCSRPMNRLSPRNGPRLDPYFLGLQIAG